VKPAPNAKGEGDGLKIGCAWEVGKERHPCSPFSFRCYPPRDGDGRRVTSRGRAGKDFLPWARKLGKI